MPVIRDNLNFSVVVPANSNGSYSYSLNNILPLPVDKHGWVKNMLLQTTSTPPTICPVIDVTCDLVKRSALFGDVILDRVAIGTNPTGMLYRELMIPIATRNQPSNIFFTFKSVDGKPFNNDQPIYLTLFIVWE